MLAFGPNPARRAALAGTVLASLLACAALLCASMTAAEARSSIHGLRMLQIDKELAKPMPPTETLLGSPGEMARLTYENAVRAYNGRKVRTKAERDYVLSLRSKYVAAHRRENTPPSEYNRPYTGNLTIERVDDPAALLKSGRCPNSKNPIGCAGWAKDLSWCRVYIVSDAYIKKHSDRMKILGASYESILRHEMAHCNGWPGDHSR